MSISVITLGELIYGAYKSQYPEKSMIAVNHIRNIFPIIELHQGIIKAAQFSNRLSCGFLHQSPHQ